jgi:hypothetical protein
VELVIRRERPARQRDESSASCDANCSGSNGRSAAEVTGSVPARGRCRDRCAPDAAPRAYGTPRRCGSGAGFGSSPAPSRRGSCSSPRCARSGISGDEFAIPASVMLRDQRTHQDARPTAPARCFGATPPPARCRRRRERGRDGESGVRTGWRDGIYRTRSTMVIPIRATGSSACMGTICPESRFHLTSAPAGS